MAGKYIFEVPPTSVGGSTSCIGVGARGLDSQKVVHADFSHLLVSYSYSSIHFMGLDKHAIFT